MTRECQHYREQIPRAMLGDLEATDQQALERHLDDCPACAKERESYAGTLLQLRSLEDEAVPRHFFVYPEERKTNPWHLFRMMRPAWQAAAAAVLILAGIVTSLAASRLQVRADNGVWTLSFGKLPEVSAPAPVLDAAALETRILKVVEEKNRRESLEWVRTLRSEIARSQKGLTQRQQIALETALANMEARVGSRIEQTTRSVLDQNERSLSGLYQAVSRQRDRDLATIDSRFARLAVTDEIKSTQTDAILETLLQVAELRMK